MHCCLPTAPISCQCRHWNAYQTHSIFLLSLPTENINENHLHKTWSYEIHSHFFHIVFVHLLFLFWISSVWVGMPITYFVCIFVCTKWRKSYMRILVILIFCIQITNRIYTYVANVCMWRKKKLIRNGWTNEELNEKKLDHFAHEMKKKTHSHRHTHSLFRCNLKGQMMTIVRRIQSKQTDNGIALETRKKSKRTPKTKATTKSYN